LKPANIFLVRDEDREIAKVLDFGIAKRTQLEVGEAHTKTGNVLGSPHYMSPEQARGLKEVDHRTDLWALGVIAFRCVVGQLPFQSESLGDLFMKIITESVPVPSQLARVPAGFDAFWARVATPTGASSPRRSWPTRWPWPSGYRRARSTHPSWFRARLARLRAPPVRRPARP